MLATGTADKSWLGSFYPGFMENSQTGGKIWGIPFQRSTVGPIWNKAAFREAGLDPEAATDELGRDGRVRQKLDQA